MANRIQILTWRQHGDDEDGTQVAVFPDDMPDADLVQSARNQVDPDFDWEAADTRLAENGEGLEDEEDFEHVIYVGFDADIEDGEVMIGPDNRRFRINVTEIPKEEQ